MSKVNIVVAGVFVLFAVYFSYTVVLADDALVKRTVKTEGENGGYQIVTNRVDGSRIIETYKVNEDGSPLSHELLMVGSEPGSEPKIMKKGTFVPKFKKQS